MSIRGEVTAAEGRTVRRVTGGQGEGRAGREAGLERTRLPG